MSYSKKNQQLISPKRKLTKVKSSKRTTPFDSVVESVSRSNIMVDQGKMSMNNTVKAVRAK